MHQEEKNLLPSYHTPINNENKQKTPPQPKIVPYFSWKKERKPDTHLLASISYSLIV